MAAKKKEVVAEAEGEEAPVKRGRGRPKGSTKSKGRGRPKGTNLKHFFLFMPPTRVIYQGVSTRKPLQEREFKFVYLKGDH